MVTWSNKGNRFHHDFEIFSTLKDAEKMRNPWKACNYNDRGVAFPRDCGPRGHVGGQWNSLTRGG